MTPQWGNGEKSVGAWRVEWHGHRKKKGKSSAPWEPHDQRPHWVGSLNSNRCVYLESLWAPDNHHSGPPRTTPPTLCSSQLGSGFSPPSCLSLSCWQISSVGLLCFLFHLCKMLPLSNPPLGNVFKLDENSHALYLDQAPGQKVMSPQACVHMLGKMFITIRILKGN